MADAVQTVMTQCELWTDNQEFVTGMRYQNYVEQPYPMAAENRERYGNGE